MLSYVEWKVCERVVLFLLILVVEGLLFCEDTSYCLFPVWEVIADKHDPCGFGLPSISVSIFIHKVVETPSASQYQATLSLMEDFIFLTDATYSLLHLYCGKYGMQNLSIHSSWF